MIHHKKSISLCVLACAIALPAVRAQGFDPSLFAPPLTLDGEVTGLGSLGGGDINEDGLRDLASLSFPYDAVLVYLAAGGGAFEPLASVAMPLQGVVFPMLRLADADGDGHLDLLCLGMHASARVVVVRLGHGDGTFDVPLTTWLENAPLVLGSDTFDVGDVSGDGLPDFVLVDPGTPLVGGSVQVAPGLGDGTFGPVQVIEPGRRPTLVQARDLDGDTLCDLVFVDTLHNDPSHIVTLQGLGGGAFAPALDGGSMPNEPADLFVADLDGDGMDDLLAAGGSNGVAGQVFLFRGRSPAAFDPASTLLMGEQVADVAAADFDADGMPDLVATDRLTPAILAQRLVRAGPVGPPVIIATVDIPTALDAGDYDGDGYPDAALVAGGTLLVYFNQLGPFVDLGFSLPSPQGTPALQLTGTPVPGGTVTVTLSGLSRPAPGLLIMGAQTVYQSFQGGVLVPSLDGAVPVTSDAALTGTWPHDIPAGTNVYVQAWFTLPAAGVAASNAVGVVSG